MRRLVKGVALAAGLTLTLAACSSDDGGSGAEAESGSALTIWADEKRAGPIGDLAKTWGDENGVEVKVTQVTFDGMKDQFIQQAPQGQGPDLLLGANDWAGEFTSSGLISPIDLGGNKDSFVQASVDGFTIESQNYAVPVSTENILLFRNTDLAPEAPKTLDEMGDTGLKLMDDGKTKFPVGLQVGSPNGDAYHAYPFFSAAGGYFFGGPDENGDYDVTDVGVASPGGLAWADHFSEWGKKGIVKSTFVGDDLANAWADGKLPYWITGPWNKEAVEESGVNFSAEGLPSWDGSEDAAVPLVGSQGFYLNAQSTNQTTAQAFLDATMNTEFMDSMYNADPRPPAWKDSLTVAEKDPIIKAVSEFGAEGYPNLPYPEMGPMFEEMGVAEVKILDGEDPAQTMNDVQASLEKQFK